MRFDNETDAVTYIFTSLAATDWRRRGLDENTRSTAPTARLLAAHDLLSTRISTRISTRGEYAVVTGSKGKGSVTAITAHLLKHLGHRVGMITSPHLVSYRERIRVDGQAIPQADFLRLVDWLAPSIDRIQQSLTPPLYLSPQGIFLAMALKYFDEQGVTAAVIEVGRGGRFDDNALVPNTLSLFTPIFLEHTRYLGPTMERIAWHKAGVIKAHSYAYSLPQPREVLDVLQREADALDAAFSWIAPTDLGQLVAPTADGLRVDFGRYGLVDLPLLGRYEIDNATLAITAAGNMHARLDSVLSHGSPEYVARIRRGLETLRWPGRCEKLQDGPAVYVDGAINVGSARAFLESVGHRLTSPTVVVAAVPLDRDYPAVYRALIPKADVLVLTRTARNVTIRFPDEATAVETARTTVHELGYDDLPIYHAASVADAIRLACALAGAAGTVLMALAQPAVSDAMVFYNADLSQV